MNSPHYSPATRRAYIDSQAHRYRHGEKAGFSLRDIAWDVKQRFGLDSPPSPTTISHDLKLIAAGKVGHSVSDEATDLLDPERFAEWRAFMFTAPNGEPYETPLHQEAWFWLITALAIRLPMPQHALDWFSEQGVDLDVNDWIANPEYLMTVWLLAPPRHGKTDLVRHVIVWLFCKHPNIRILFASLNKDIAALTTGWLKRELEENEKLIEWYGPFQKEGSWTDREFTIATRTVNLASSSIVALGKGSGALSRDADLILLDDLVDIKASESPSQIQRDLRALKSNIFSRREPHTPVLGIGSHAPSPVGDMYVQMEKEEKDNPSDYLRIRIVKIKAHNYENCRSGDTPDEKHGEWCILWNTIRPYWFLEAMRHQYGDTMFEVIFNQQSQEGRIDYFREKVIRGDFLIPIMDRELNRYADPDLMRNTPGVLDRSRSFGVAAACCERTNMFTALGFDPAAGETRYAAESALVVMAGCRHCGRRYIIDLWHDRISPERHPDTIDRYASNYRVQRVRIEINAYQKALARDPRLIESAAASRFVIDEWLTDERRDDPMIGVPVIARHMEAGKFSVPYQHPADHEKAEPLLKQLLNWPEKPNDLAFALWLADLSISQMIEESQYSAPMRMPGWDDLPDYLKEQVRSIDLSEVAWE